MAAASDLRNSRRFVLDGSVAISWCFPDEGKKPAQGFLTGLAQGIAVVPALWWLEVSNALVTGERRKRLLQTETAAALRLLGRLPIEIDDRSGFPLAADTLFLARKWSLTAYDAAYLELALRLSLPLCTLDHDLQKAAKAAGVSLYAA